VSEDDRRADCDGASRYSAQVVKCAKRSSRAGWSVVVASGGRAQAARSVAERAGSLHRSNITFDGVESAGSMPHLDAMWSRNGLEM
jgi:phosphoserine phosphatase